MAEKKIAAPFMADARIASEQANGIALRDKQMKPRFAGTEPFSSGQSTLLHALLGLQAGTKAAAQTSQLQSPLVSLLAGLGAGAGVPGAVEEMGIEKIGNRPVDEVSPDLVKQYPELSGVPLSLIHKLTPLIGRLHGFEQQLALAQAKSSQQADMAVLRSGLADGRNNVTLEEAKRFEMATKIPAQYFSGMDKQTVSQQLSVFKPAQKQAEALIAAEKQIEILKSKWDEVKGDVGAVEGSLRKMSKGYGSKQNAKLTAYEDARQAAITSIRKLFADSGAPSNFDVERYLNAIPGASTNVDRAGENWLTLGQMQASGKSALQQASPLVEYTFGGSLPAQSKTYSQTATNPKTGQKIGLNAQGQWEVIR